MKIITLFRQIKNEKSRLRFVYRRLLRKWDESHLFCDRKRAEKLHELYTEADDEVAKILKQERQEAVDKYKTGL